MSTPFSPALMNVGPSHLIIEYVALKATPLRASDATSGAPSPWKVFARIATHATVNERRLYVSALVRAEVVVVMIALVGNECPL
jgi:hypothetical protein